MDCEILGMGSASARQSVSNSSTFVDLGGGGGVDEVLLLLDDNGLSYFWHNQDVIGAE